MEQASKEFLQEVQIENPLKKVATMLLSRS